METFILEKIINDLTVTVANLTLEKAEYKARYEAIIAKSDGETKREKEKGDNQ